MVPNRSMGLQKQDDMFSSEEGKIVEVYLMFDARNENYLTNTKRSRTILKAKLKI